jgi:HSP20 family protein
MIRRKRSFFDDVNESELENMVENLLEESMWDLSRHEIRPLTTLRECKDRIIVSIDLPYVRKDDIQLNVKEDKIEVSAIMNRCIKYDRWGTVQRDCEFRSYRTILNLPQKVVPEGAEARFKSGVLEVKLPKKTKYYRINIE